MRNRNKNSNRGRYQAPAGIPEQKHAEIVSNVVAMLNEMEPVGGYGRGPIENEDKPVLNAILDYLASEGIHPDSLPSLPSKPRTSPIRRK